MDKLKELEQEQRELAKRQEELADKIKKLRETGFKTGHFYKGTSGTIVFCTSPEGQYYYNFSGININDGEGFGFGQIFDCWIKESFTEVIPEWRKVDENKKR